MWLQYGVSADCQLVPIEAVKSGKTDLVCPYCGGWLTAKKGKVKAHHFAHSGQTCYPVARREVPSLPLYDNFHIQLSGKELQQLQQLWQEYGETDYGIPAVPFRLVVRHLFAWCDRLVPRGYQFTDLGKIPVGALRLKEFNCVQEPLLLERLQQLQMAANRARMLGRSDSDRCAIDLAIYRAQMQRILRLKLYFLQVQGDGEIFYKIGVTQRVMSDRLQEIERDLRSHFQHLDIEVLGTWLHRGNVELYFKHRYHEFNYPIGKLTEYFKFSEVEPILTDLERMESKNLQPVEEEILQEVAMIHLQDRRLAEP